MGLLGDGLLRGPGEPPHSEGPLDFSSGGVSSNSLVRNTQRTRWLGYKALLSALERWKVEACVFGTRLGAPGQPELHGKTLTERKKQRSTNQPNQPTRKKFKIRPNQANKHPNKHTYKKSFGKIHFYLRLENSLCLLPNIYTAQGFPLCVARECVHFPHWPLHVSFKRFSLHPHPAFPSCLPAVTQHV